MNTLSMNPVLFILIMPRARVNIYEQQRQISIILYFYRLSVISYQLSVIGYFVDVIFIRGN